MANIRILNDVLLIPYTTFKIGGLAKYFFEAKTKEEIIEAIKWAKEQGLKYFILGGGSNVLISDQGFEGLVIKIKNQKLNIKDNEITAEAGLPLVQLIDFAAKSGLAGLEWAAGIPGTVGGAIRGNAGAMGISISESVENAEVLDSHYENKKSKIKNQKYKFKIKKLLKKGCQFGYRNSIFKQDQNLIILSVKIRLQKGERKESQKKIQEYLEKRKNQPLEPSAGCVFKNIEIANLHEFEHPEASARWRSYGAGECHEDGKEFVKIRGQLVPIRDNKIAAGWLIEQCDLKGKQIGQAKISEKHANFIVNLGGAKAEEVVMLISLIKQKVRDVFNIQLEEEIEIL